MEKIDWENWHVRFAEALDAHKKKSGQVDEDVAVAAEVSRASITHWKKGIRTPQLRNFFLACDAIGADPAYILFGLSSRQTNDLARRIAKLPITEMNALILVLEGVEARQSKFTQPIAVNHQ